MTAVSEATTVKSQFSEPVAAPESSGGASGFARDRSPGLATGTSRPRRVRSLEAQHQGRRAGVRSARAEAPAVRSYAPMEGSRRVATARPRAAVPCGSDRNSEALVLVGAAVFAFAVVFLIGLAGMGGAGL